MHSSKFITVGLFVVAATFGFSPSVVIADMPTTTPTSMPAKAEQSTETSKAIADMKEEIRKLKDEVEKLKRQLQQRKENADQKRAAKAAAKKQQEMQEANSPTPPAAQ